MIEALGYIAAAVFVGAIWIGTECVANDAEAPEPPDPYRLDRWRAGEPERPDEMP